jgi:hypothetical protein
MHRRTFWKTVAVDKSDLLDRFLTLLRERHVRFCVIGGQGVNAYAEPVVSLDLDLVIALGDLDALTPTLESLFHVERFEHSLNISADGSDLRVQIQLDPRYRTFVDRAHERDVLARLAHPGAGSRDTARGGRDARWPSPAIGPARRLRMAVKAWAGRAGAAPARRPGFVTGLAERRL